MPVRIPSTMFLRPPCELAFGRYRIVGELGAGGMARVYLARVDSLGGFQKWIAIKRIHSRFCANDAVVDMFLDEARVVAQIAHPNVATVFDIGHDGDTYWIAMEYLHGESVDAILRIVEERGLPMPAEVAATVIADAAEGLHAAHELVGSSGEKLELIHRDVSPQNIFVTYGGTTKVVDFGIAKFRSRSVRGTLQGELRGKLAYMSPEHISSQPTDRRTDVFALGVVLWEMTTGRRLFRGRSDAETLSNICAGRVPRPSTVVADYPPRLEAIVMRALASAPADRFQTARDLSRALRAYVFAAGFFTTEAVANYLERLLGKRIEQHNAALRFALEARTAQASVHDRSLEDEMTISTATLHDTLPDPPLDERHPLPDVTEPALVPVPLPSIRPCASALVAAPARRASLAGPAIAFTLSFLLAILLVFAGELRMHGKSAAPAAGEPPIAPADESQPLAESPPAEPERATVDAGPSRSIEVR